jgi:hypothetical protein
MALLFLLAAGGSDDDAQKTAEAPAPRNRRSTDHQNATDQKDATNRKEVKDPSHAAH